jgi:hypothetical protein
MNIKFNKAWGCIRKFPDWGDNEINNNKHSLRSNTKGDGGKTDQIDSQNNDTTAPSGRELNICSSRSSPETFGYTIVCKIATNTFGKNVPTKLEHRSAPLDSIMERKHQFIVCVCNSIKFASVLRLGKM